jgi:hypothetical protein
MALTQQKKRARVKFLLLIGGIIGLFAAMQSKALMHRHPPGYLDQPPAGQFQALSWDELQKANWVYGHKPVVPESLRALNGKQVKVRGFLLPLHSAVKGSQFFMSNTPGGCYFCNPPAVNSVVQLNLAGGKELDLCAGAVDAYGTFHVATGAPTDHVLYWMDEVKLVAF